MNTRQSRLMLVLLVLLAVSALPLRANNITPIAYPAPPPADTFFVGGTYLGNDPNGYPVYYLSYFNTFTFDGGSDANYFYKYDFGWLYYFGGTTAASDDAYLYDFATDDVFYTSASLYPYFYSFNLDTFLYYSEGSDPRYRYFYDFSTQSYVYYPAVNTTF